jgi:DNA-binding transcriptional MerR regulator
MMSVMSRQDVGYLRVGEVSRRVGVSEHVLRAWERRYGLVSPERSQAGYRLYSEADVRAFETMRAHVGAGLSAAEAARAVLEAASGADSPRGVSTPTAVRQDEGVGHEAHADQLRASLEAFDDESAQELLDRLLAQFSVETVLEHVILPCLRSLGEGWARGSVSVAQEHFASQLVRSRLATLARGWGRGVGPRAVLATAPQERHDMALMIFGICLHRWGWRIRYLGADTPTEELTAMVTVAPPDLVVVTVTAPAQRVDPAPLVELARRAPLALAGSQAAAELAETIGARLLQGSPVAAAREVATTWQTGATDQ